MANETAKWLGLAYLAQEQTVVQAKIVAVVPSLAGEGLIARFQVQLQGVDGITAILRMPDLDRRYRVKGARTASEINRAYVGVTLPVVVTELPADGQKEVIVNSTLASQKLREERMAEIEAMRTPQTAKPVVSGTVYAIDEKGAHVYLGKELVGYLHHTRLSLTGNLKVADVVRIGETREFTVGNVDKENGYVQLTLRGSICKEYLSKVKVGQTVVGKIGENEGGMYVDLNGPIHGQIVDQQLALRPYQAGQLRLFTVKVRNMKANFGALQLAPFDGEAFPRLARHALAAMKNVPYRTELLKQIARIGYVIEPVDKVALEQARSIAPSAAPRKPAHPVVSSILAGDATPAEPEDKEAKARQRLWRESLPPEELCNAIQDRIRDMGNVLWSPLIDAVAPERKAQVATLVKHRQRIGAKKYFGQYISFDGEERNIPALNEHTIYGLATLDSRVLQGVEMTAADFLELGARASEHRRDEGFGGGDIIAQTAEFYVRLFRSMLITPVEIEKLGPKDLATLVDYVIRLYASATKERADGGHQVFQHAS